MLGKDPVNPGPGGHRPGRIKRRGVRMALDSYLIVTESKSNAPTVTSGTERALDERPAD